MFDLLKGCEDYFSRVYFECVDLFYYGLIMCFVVFKFGYIVLCGEVFGVIFLSGIEKVIFIGDVDEFKIFEVLEIFGGEMK